MIDQQTIILSCMVIGTCSFVFMCGIIAGLQIKKSNRDESLDIIYRLATEDRAAVRRDVEEEGGDVDVDSWNDAHAAGNGR